MTATLIAGTFGRRTTALHTKNFDFDLPPELIAQAPCEPRDAARLLTFRDGEVAHRSVADLPSLVSVGDLLVFNDTRVLHARVFAKRATGGRQELLFQGPSPDAVQADPSGSGTLTTEPWTALVRPAKKLRPGDRLECEADPRIAIEAIRREGPESGVWFVRFLVAEDAAMAGDVLSTESLLTRVGAVPLPPYIDRAASPRDAETYQTIYAKKDGAVAAPTAGLHFTPQVFDALDDAGVERAFVTLHVGAGTFRPVRAERIEDHEMHEERFVLSQETIEQVRACRARGGRVIAVGTTSARVLESCSAEILRAGPPSDIAGSTRLFLHPGNTPCVIDGLFTNFHLPQSTLIMLVSSLVGREATLELYGIAIEERYRFYSYGDAMLLLPREPVSRSSR